MIKLYYISNQILITDFLLNFIYKQIHFTSSLRKRVITGLTLGIFLSFLIIFLEPFDTNQFQAEYRILLLSGFGVTFFISYLIYSSLENNWYNRKDEVWRISDEVLSILIFFLLTGTAVFLYNQIIVNQINYSFDKHIWYLTHIVACMIPVMTPFLIYLRQKLGELNIPKSPDTFFIKGENKNEILELAREDLLYVKSLENYVDIVYSAAADQLATQTFRQTLSKVQNQVPFLKKCHRSYLINSMNIKCIEGNSQSAKIHIRNTDQHIPLSKTFYHKIKNSMAE